jgi:hypothetical protein
MRCLRNKMSKSPMSVDLISVALGVCCASRNQHQKIAEQAIFYLANSQSSP